MFSHNPLGRPSSICKRSRALLFRALLATSVLYGALFFIGYTSAQEVPNADLPITKQPTSEIAPGSPTNTSPQNTQPVAVNSATPSILKEVIIDETITTQDMGAHDARILPDNPLHIFKRFGNALEEIVTINPVAKATKQLENANQQLAEVKQLIEKRGIEHVEPRVLNTALTYYETKIEKVKENASIIKDKRTQYPEQVDTLLNELTDKQLIKQQKIIDYIAQKALNYKKQINSGNAAPQDQQIEQMIARFEDAKERAVEHAAYTLSTIEPPEALTKRLTDVTEKQKGSEFNDIKNLEILETVAKKAPRDAHDAIKQAQQITLERFETKIQTLTPRVRAHTFEQYILQATADETQLMAILDDIKLSSRLPQDILDKIEKAKEITVKKFEEKLTLLKGAETEDRLLKKLEYNEYDDLVILKEFRNRMKRESEVFAKMDELHTRSLTQFKNEFTDAQSQEQVARFAELSQFIKKNPTPKAISLLRDLETEVRQNPEKAAFLNNIENEVQQDIERRFRQEGERAFKRFATFDPHDMGVFEGFEFDEEFENRLATNNTGTYKRLMQEINNPDEFDAFQERWNGVPDSVVNKIKNTDPTFQDAMQFKARTMFKTRLDNNREIEQAKLDYQERETRHVLDQYEQQQWDEFNQKLSNIPWENFSERKALWEARISEQLTYVEQHSNEQKKLFEQRMKLDPWCDETCQHIQLQFLEQEIRHERERLAQDLVRERNRIEREKEQYRQDNPLAQVCNTPETCEQYCYEHPDSDGCEWMIIESEPFLCPPPKYFDSQTKRCVTPSGAELAGITLCAEGEYFNGKACVIDPYWKPPTDFENCPWGMHWNSRGSFCEPDFKPSPSEPYPGQNPVQGCPPNAFWDNEQGYCIPECPSGNYFDHYRGCVPELKCPEGTYSDFYTGECIKECGSGEYFDFHEKQCKQDKWRECGQGYFWNAKKEVCEKELINCPLSPVRTCAPGEVPVPPRPHDPCGQPSCIPDLHTCPDLTAVSPASCPNGQYREIIKNRDGCDIFGACIPAEQPRPCLSGEYFDSKLGRCAPNPPPITSCTEQWTPVCGTNGTTYGNDCKAKQAGVGIKYYGECEKRTTECSTGTFWVPEINLCLSERDYVPSTSGKCEYGWVWNSKGYCAQDTTIVGECKNTCDPVCGSSQYCEFDQFGCAVGCITQPSSAYCGDKVCNNNETASSCPTDCGNTYPGDANSCPGFAYSRWDNNGKRYCQLNNERKCDYNYPGYLTNDGSYTETNCPSDDNKGATCSSSIYNNYTTSGACNYSNCPNGCNFDTNGCPTGCYENNSDGYCGDGHCSGKENTSGSCASDCGATPVSCPSNKYNAYGTDGACDPGVCSSGCVFDTKGCPTGCNSTTSGTGYCGDKVCNNNETASSCSSDCAGSSGSCSSTIYNNYTSGYACNYTKCPNGCNYDSTGCATGCWSMESSCSNMSGWHYDSTTNTCVRDGKTCSNPNACSACPSGSNNTSSWCQYDNDGCPTGCQDSSSTGYCGDNWCSSSENSTSCPSDCGSYNGSSCNYNGTCEDGENSGNCWDDCGDNNNTGVICPSTEYNNYTTGNTCSYSACPNGCMWDSSSCPIGCDTGSTSSSYCGNGVCDPNESSSSCHDDCGSSGSSCASDYNYCYTDVECNDNGYGWCNGYCWSSYESSPCATADSCGDGSCTGSETTSSCPSDCGPSYYCGDGSCNQGEDSYSCETDCGPAEYCGDGSCNGGETSESCSTDCGEPSPPPTQ